MKLKAVQYEVGTIWVTGDGFHNKNLKDGDLAYHRGIHKVGTVSNYEEMTGIWEFECNGAFTPRDEYKLFKVVAQSVELSIPSIPYVILERNEPLDTLQVLMEDLPVDFEGTRSDYGAELEQKEWRKEWDKAYKAAQSNIYSEADMEGLLRFAHNNPMSGDYETVVKNYIQFITEPKEIEIEMRDVPHNYQPYERKKNSTDIVPDYFIKKPVTYQKYGKTFLKVLK
jgi:hypothetical protein